MTDFFGCDHYNHPPIAGSRVPLEHQCDHNPLMMPIVVLRETYGMEPDDWQLNHIERINRGLRGGTQ